MTRALKPTNPDWHKKLMQVLTELEGSVKMATKFDLVFDINEILESSDISIPVIFKSMSDLPITIKLMLDPQKQDLNGQLGLKVGCVLKRSNKKVIHRPTIDLVPPTN
jgi:hypothetical protein